MKKRMVIMLLSISLLFGSIFAYQVFKAKMIKKYMLQGASHPVAVSAMKIKAEAWQKKIKATGSLRAIQGVDITTEIAGLVKSIHFTPGTPVKKDTRIIQLNADTEIAELQSLQAALKIAQITYDRDKAQFAIHAISKQTLDNDEATLKAAIAQVNQQQSIIAKKDIRAPFTGKLGISQVNLGQYINVGDKIVTLQTLDPIYIDFFLPQQELAQLAIGQSIEITTDTYPGKIYKGKITTISPLVDAATRNVQIEATIANPRQELFPGMFANTEITIGKPQPLLTLPQTAINYNPYGDIAYIVKEEGKDPQGNVRYIAHQTFVSIGETRGDQVSILKGLKAGDMVITSGQLKLKNGSQVKVNNAILPDNNPTPTALDQ